MILILFGTFFTILTYIFKEGLPAKSSVYPFKNCSNKQDKMILIDMKDTYIPLSSFKKCANEIQINKSQDASPTAALTEVFKKNSMKRCYIK